jgi:cytochrome c oxidase subunit 1
MHVFNWLATLWGGRIRFSSPMAFVTGGMVLFFFAGAGGIVNTAMPLDFITHGSYWVVGHFHLFVMGMITFGFIGFLLYMFPFITGRMYNERAAMTAFWLFFVGVSMIFLTQHVLGLYGQPRRVFDYVPVQPIIILNQISTVGAWITATGAALLLGLLIHGSMKGKFADMKDPFKLGETYYPIAAKEPHH